MYESSQRRRDPVMMVEIPGTFPKQRRSPVGSRELRRHLTCHPGYLHPADVCMSASGRYKNDAAFAVAIDHDLCFIGDVVNTAASQGPRRSSALFPALLPFLVRPKLQVLNVTRSTNKQNMFTCSQQLGNLERSQFSTPHELDHRRNSFDGPVALQELS